jgi:hypothetical protein
MVDSMGETAKNTAPYLAVASGFVAIFYSFYYAEQLSYTIGFNTGLIAIVNQYNISASNSLALSNAVLGMQALRFAAYIPYLMLPFALIMFGIGVLWLFSRSHQRITSISIGFASLIFVMLSILLEFNLNFSASAALLIFSLAIAAGVMGIIASLVGFREGFSQSERMPSARPIVMDPKTPYTNMINLSNRLKLSGDVRILDMHFDYKSAENLSRMISRSAGNYHTISLLTKKDRLGSDFMKSYADLKDELNALNVSMEIRILDPKDALEQHERLLIDSSKAYKIPPINIINKKSEHIVGVNYQNALSRFSDLWARATKYENAAQ